MFYPDFLAKLIPDANRVMDGRRNVDWGIDVFISKLFSPPMLVDFSHLAMVSAHVQSVHAPFRSQNQRVCKLVRGPVVSALNEDVPTGIGLDFSAKRPCRRAVLIIRPADVPLYSFGTRQYGVEFGVAQRHALAFPPNGLRLPAAAARCRVAGDAPASG